MNVKCWVLSPIIDRNGLSQFDLMQINLKIIVVDEQKKAVVHGKN